MNKILKDNNYEYLNLNPNNENASDCVCRAIALGTNEKYETIERKLQLVAELFECEELCLCCYQHLLDYVYSFKKIYLDEIVTIKDFLKMNPNGIYIIRIEGHLTCAMNGTIYDSWDCSDKLVDVVWVVYQ